MQGLFISATSSINELIYHYYHATVCYMWVLDGHTLAWDQSLVVGISICTWKLSCLSYHCVGTDHGNIKYGSPDDQVPISFSLFLHISFCVAHDLLHSNIFIGRVIICMNRFLDKFFDLFIDISRKKKYDIWKFLIILALPVSPFGNPAISRSFVISNLVSYGIFCLVGCWIW